MESVTEQFIMTDDLLATRSQRFMNFVFDILFISIINASIMATIMIVASMTNNDALSNWFMENKKIIPVMWIAVAFFYYSLTEMYFSRTVAKYITKTIVVMRDGSRLNSKAVLRRTLCRFIPFEPFSFLGENHRGWHDSFSDTYVVKKHRFNKRQGHVPFLG